MATYYVFAPDYKVTAEVEASNTKHARTTLLDYLSRNGIISWADRQAFRKKLKAVRMDPGEFQTTVKLEYGVSEPPELELAGPITEELDPQEDTSREDTSQGDLNTVPSITPGGQNPFGNSPIARVSRQLAKVSDRLKGVS